jgi:hypothetical protein
MQVRDPRSGSVDRVDIHKVVFTSKCPHCAGDFYPGQVVVSVGVPYMCLFHINCAVFYDYSKGWPHEKPLNWYMDNTLPKPV